MSAADAKLQFPDFIKNLPQADIPMSDATGYLLSGDHGQVVFFELPGGVKVPPHSHCAQWGLVVEGQLKLTIGDEVHDLGPGDYYFIPEGVEHSAEIKTPCRVLDVFADSDRYSAK